MEGVFLPETTTKTVTEKARPPTLAERQIDPCSRTRESKRQMALEWTAIVQTILTLTATLACPICGPVRQTPVRAHGVPGVGEKRAVYYHHPARCGECGKIRRDPTSLRARRTRQVQSRGCTRVPSMDG